MNFKPAIDKLIQLSPLGGAIGPIGEIPGILDVAKNVVGNVTSSDADQKAKIQAVIDADRAEREKMMMAQSRPQGRMMRQDQVADDGGYKSYKKGGKVSSASKRADGCAIKGKTRGKMV
jgi:hypothetical protein